MSRQITLGHSTYPSYCVKNAVAAYEPVCKVSIVESKCDSTSVLIEAPANIDEVSLVGEFLNYLLDMSMESHFQKS